MKKKNTTLELTINPHYVRDWGVWEAIRELLQNAADAHDMGYPMRVEYKPNLKVPALEITTEGTTISRETLLLGGTTKADDSKQRGKFGEGYKLAWLVLARMGYKVWCKSGNERWVPSISHSVNFDSKVLMIDVAPAEWENTVKMRIYGVHPDDWEIVKKRCHFLNNSPLPAFKGDDGNKLYDSEDLCGKLFCNGIFVSQLPGRYHFGYDLPNLELDRDRRLANPWSLKHSITALFRDAVNSEWLSVESVYKMLLDAESGEAQALYSYLDYKTDLNDQIAQYFLDLHGEEALPVDSMSAALEAEHYGIRGIVVPLGLMKIIEVGLNNSFEKRKTEGVTDISETWQLHSLDEEEKASLSWAIDRLKRIELNMPILVVTYRGEDVFAHYKSGEIGLARKMLKMSKGRLITALIHEASHMSGSDGSTQHRDTIDHLFGKLVESYEE